MTEHVSPLEAAIRACCTALGADPETWRGFADIGRTALAGLVAALPPHLAGPLGEHLRSLGDLEAGR